ncbi:MAG: hypothetical protein PUB87_01675 [Eubacteriaceae bacterium]|nr:hypothetical protein [Eubacteriaceae bacterium]
MIDVKSKVLEMYDFREIDLKPLILPFELDEAQLEKDLNMVQKKHSHLVTVDQIEEGDFASISCKSDAKKYNRERVTVKVGKGLYSAELETQLIGMKPGERKRVTADGNTVDVKVIKADRSILPELNDENVPSFGIKDVTTVDELRQYFIDIQHRNDTEQTVEDVAGYIQGIAINRSVFEMDDEELAEQRKLSDELLAAMKEAYPESGETTDEQRESMFEFMLTGYKAGVIGIELMKQNNITPTDEDYERSIEAEMEQNECSRDEVLSYMPRESFEKQYPSSYYLWTIQQYVREYIEKLEGENK